MKLPKSITIYVVESDEVDKNFQINTDFEILVRKLLNIFAQNPAMFAPVHSRLAEEVCKYGPSSLGKG